MYWRWRWRHFLHHFHGGTARRFRHLVHRTQPPDPLSLMSLECLQHNLHDCLQLFTLQFDELSINDRTTSSEVECL